MSEFIDTCLPPEAIQTIQTSALCSAEICDRTIHGASGSGPVSIGPIGSGIQLGVGFVFVIVIVIGVDIFFRVIDQQGACGFQIVLDNSQSRLSDQAPHSGYATGWLN